MRSRPAIGARRSAQASERPFENQQMAPALNPASTAPASQACRSSTSSPHSFHSASMLSVFPPLTRMTSCSGTYFSRLDTRPNSLRSESSQERLEKLCDERLGVTARRRQEADSRSRPPRLRDNVREERQVFLGGNASDCNYLLSGFHSAPEPANGSALSCERR